MALGGANVSSRMAGSTGDLLLKIVISSNIVYKYIFMLSRRFMLYKAFSKNVKCYTYIYICIIVYVYIYIYIYYMGNSEIYII